MTLIIYLLGQGGAVPGGAQEGGAHVHHGHVVIAAARSGKRKKNIVIY